MNFNLNTNTKTQNKEKNGLPLQIPQTTETDLEMAIQSHERLINDLADFIKGKMNVHGEIRKITGSLGSSFKKLSLVLEKSSLEARRPSTSNVETQTDSSQLKPHPEATKKNVETYNEVAKATPKARKTKRKERTSPEEAHKATKKRKNEASPSPPSLATQVEKVSLQEPAWQNVKKKKPIKKKSNVRPNAVLIRPKEKEKYADILKRVKQDAATENVSQYVDKIRRTTAGDMLLVLTKNNNDKAAEVKKTIADILGSEAVVVSKVPEVAIEIRDLDETTTKQEVLEALHKVVNDSDSITLDTVKSLRQTYGGTQTATVRVDEKTAMKIFGNTGKIKIGWVNCRVRRVETPIKCYKCWRYGHLAGKCTSTIDRSNWCVKCGGKGHKIIECKNDVACVLCTEDGKKKDDCAHIAGCGRCPAFQAALQMVRKKR